MPLPLNRYTPAGIAAQTQADYDAWVAQQQELLARQQEQAAAAQAQQDAAAQEAQAAELRNQAFALQVQYEQAIERLGQFSNPALRTGTEKGRATNTSAPPPAAAQPNQFDQFLATQTLHPSVRTRADYDALPRPVQQALFDAAWPGIVKGQNWGVRQSVTERKQAQAKLVTAPPDGVNVGDWARAGASGFVSAFKSIVSTVDPNNDLAATLEGYEKQLGDGRSEASKRHEAYLNKEMARARAAGKTDEEIAAFFSSKLGATLGETVANVMGGMLGFLALPAAIAGATAVAVPAAVGTMFAGTAAAVGAASGFGGVRRTAFEAARDDALAAKAGQEEAVRRGEAAASRSDVLLLGGAGAALGLVGARTGAEKVVAQTVANQLVATSGRKTALQALKTAGADAAVGATQNATEQFAGNVGSAGVGNDVALGRGVALAAAQGLVLDGAAGATVSGAGNMLARARTAAPALAPAPAPALAPAPAPAPALAPVAAPAPAAPPAQAAATVPPSAAPTQSVSGVTDVAINAAGNPSVMVPAPTEFASTASLRRYLNDSGLDVDSATLAPIEQELRTNGRVSAQMLAQAAGLAELPQRPLDLTRQSEGADISQLRRAENSAKVDTTITRWLTENIGKETADAAQLAREAAASANNPFDKGMFEWLSERMVGTTVQADDMQAFRPGVGGDYILNANAIRINVGSGGEGVSARVVMHEMLHAATANVITGRVTSTDSQRAALDTISGLYKQYLALGVNDNVASKLRGFAADRTGVAEFVAEGLSNHLLRGVLRSQKLTDGTTMWEKFRNSLRGLVGLPTSVAPDNMLDALLDAVDTLAPPNTKLQAEATLNAADTIFESGLKAATSDAIFVRGGADGAGTVRGSAVFDPATSTYHAVWYEPSGRVLRSGALAANVNGQGNPNPIQAQVDLHDWFTDRDPLYGYVSDQRHSDQKLNTQKLINELDALSPGARAVYEKLTTTVARVPKLRDVLGEATILQATRALSGLWQYGVNRHAPTDTIRDGTLKYEREMVHQLVAERGMTQAQAEGTVAQIISGLGTDGIIRRSAQATAERTNVSAGADPNWAQHKASAVEQFKTLVAKGVPHEIAMDYAAAISSAQANAVRAAQYPTDINGRPADPDKTKFSFYTDAAGRIIPLADGGQPPPGATKHSGVSAPLVFKTMFAQQFPNAVADANKLMDVVSEGNLRVLQIQLANGAITTKEFNDMKAQSFYLPMQQTDGRLKARGGPATGRHTKAANPLAQWMAVLDARVDHAAWAGSVRDIVRALQLAPNPALGTIGAYTRKLKPDETQSGQSTVDMVKADFIGERSVLVREGNETYSFTIEDAGLLRALKPGTIGSIQPAVDAARKITHFQSFVRVAANLSFLAAQIPLDAMTGVLNAQGAWRSVRDGGVALNTAQARTLAVKLLPQALGAMAGAIRNQTPGRLTAKRTAMRRLYDAHGGGIHMDAVIGYTQGLDMLGAGSQAFGGSTGAVARSLMGKSEHAVQAVGHIWSDAIRFAGFKLYLEARNGQPFRSDAELKRFIDNNPSALAEAVTGSKNLLGNFERTGTDVLLKAVIPFFNATMVGNTQLLPQILTTAHGRQMTALVAATVFFSAMAKMSSEDDKDDDGVSKFLSGTSAWKDLVVGGNKMPLPLELRGIIAPVVMAAAAVSGAVPPPGMLVERLMSVLLDFSPIRVPEFDGTSIMHALGILGIPLMVSAGLDSYGRPTTRGGPTAGPEHLQARTSDTGTAVATAELLHDILGADVAPGTITTYMQQFGGALYSMGNEMHKGSLDGRGASGAALEWVSKRFVYDAEKESAFGVQRRLKHVENEKLAERDEGILEENTQIITDARRQVSEAKGIDGLSLGQMILEQAKARRAGDAARYQALAESIKEVSAEQRALRAGTINMLLNR